MSKKKKGKTKPKKSKNPVSKTIKKGSANRTSLFLLGGLLALFAFLIYANTLGHDYALDDYSAIKENFVTKKGVGGLKEIFTEHYRYGYWSSRGTLYRPMSLAMFAVEWNIAEDSPGFHHFINVLLYAFTAFFLFWTLSKLLEDKGPLLPFLATLLFIAHPLHVEVVANIKSRDEILSFLFCMAAVYGLWKYFKLKNIKWLLIAGLFYLVAMFSKESAITFLAVFPLIGYFFLKKDIGNSIIPALVFIVPVGIYLFARSMVLDSVLAGSSGISILDNAIMDAKGKGEQLATAFVLAGKYLKNLFIPHPLGSDFGFPQVQAVGWGDWRAILTFLLFLGMAIFAFLKFTKRSMLSFGILYFFITFSIFSNMIIKIGTSYGDRLMYVPSLGFAIAIAYLIVLFTSGEEKYKLGNVGAFFKKYMIPLAITGIIAAAFSIKTISRNSVWENSHSLYENDILIAPNSAKLNYHYGLELNKKGLAATAAADKKVFFESAMAQFAKATQLHPDYSDAYGQIGLLFYRIKDYNQAITNYQKAIELKPGANAYSNLGTAYFETGKVQEAITAYQNAVRANPRFVDARRNLGASYARIKRFQDAIKEFQEALKYEPNDALIHLYIGSAYRDLGDPNNAKIWMDKAYQLDPSLRK